MADITYCDNKACPFKDCERHPCRIPEACLNGRGYVSVASFDGVCRRYISNVVRKVRETRRGKA